MNSIAKFIRKPWGPRDISGLMPCPSSLFSSSSLLSLIPFSLSLSSLLHTYIQCSFFVIQECELLVSNTNVTNTLLGNCSVLLANTSVYLPLPSLLVQSNFSLLPSTPQLNQLSKQLQQIPVDPSSLVEASRDGYQTFLLSLVSE